jgi:hypothetical protein
LAAASACVAACGHCVLHTSACWGVWLCGQADSDTVQLLDIECSVLLFFPPLCALLFVIMSLNQAVATEAAGGTVTQPHISLHFRNSPTCCNSPPGAKDSSTKPMPETRRPTVLLQTPIPAALAGVS